MRFAAKIDDSLKSERPNCITTRISFTKEPPDPPKELQIVTTKRPVVHLSGTAKYKKTIVNVEVKITDFVYEFGILKDDIRGKRLWLEAPPDNDGWMKLLYSADGPTGDPIPIGKIKFDVDAEQFDPNFGDFSNLTLKQPTKG